MTDTVVSLDAGTSAGSGVAADVVEGLRLDALATLAAVDLPAGRQSRLRDEFVAHLASSELNAAPTMRACTPAHLTAGVLVLSEDLNHVLLTLHSKAQRWFHFGGHIEPGDVTLAAAALREGLEESGLASLALSPEPVHLDSHTVAFCGTHPEVTHLDVRYTALAPSEAEFAVSEESLDVRWWPLNALPDDFEDEMHELIATCRAHWSQRHSN